jgi:hypothetical protein
VIGWSPFSLILAETDVVKTEPLSPKTKVLEGAETDDSQLHILWQPISDPETGLDQVLEYIVYWDNGSNEAQWV